MKTRKALKALKALNALKARFLVQFGTKTTVFGSGLEPKTRNVVKALKALKARFLVPVLNPKHGFWFKFVTKNGASRAYTVFGSEPKTV